VEILWYISNIIHIISTFMKEYYLYTHTRLDTGEIFYVGIGSRYSKFNNFQRAINKTDRNIFWKRIVNKTKYRVDIIALFFDENECNKAEILLIEKIGRRKDYKGTLSNIAPGGTLWKKAKKIYQYDLDGNYITEWESPGLAGNILNLSYLNIYSSCRLHTRVGKYQFRDFKTKNIDAYINKKLKKVYKFSRIGEYIEEYSSITEAENKNKLSTNLLSKGKIDTGKICGNYIWSSKRNECFIKSVIEQCDLNGSLIKRYSSLIDVKQKLNLKSHNSIDSAIKGIVQKQAYGFIWKRINNLTLKNHE